MVFLLALNLFSAHVTSQNEGEQAVLRMPKCVAYILQTDDSK